MLSNFGSGVMPLVALAKTCRRAPVKYTSGAGFVVLPVVGAFLHEPGGGSLESNPIESEQEEGELRPDNVGTATAGLTQK
jgi:hypothetical protein